MVAFIFPKTVLVKLLQWNTDNNSSFLGKWLWTLVNTSQISLALFLEFGSMSYICPQSKINLSRYYRYRFLQVCLDLGLNFGRLMRLLVIFRGFMNGTQSKMQKTMPGLSLWDSWQCGLFLGQSPMKSFQDKTTKLASQSFDRWTLCVRNVVGKVSFSTDSSPS